jgi:hypothetical protein
MPYISCRFGKLLALRWTATPILSDTDQLVADARAAREAAGGQLRLLVVIPIRDVDMPSADVRARMRLLFADLLQNFQSVDTVFEGSGITASLIRTLMRSMVLVTRREFDHQFHTTTQDAFRRLERAESFDAPRTLHALRVSKIIRD